MTETRLFQHGDPVYLEGRDRVRFLRYLEGRPGMAEVMWGREVFPIPALLLHVAPEKSPEVVAEGKPTPEIERGPSRPPQRETRVYPKVIDLRLWVGSIPPAYWNAAWVVIDGGGIVRKNRTGPTGIHVDDLHQDLEALSECS